MTGIRKQSTENRFIIFLKQLFLSLLLPLLFIQRLLLLFVRLVLDLLNSCTYLKLNHALINLFLSWLFSRTISLFLWTNHINLLLNINIFISLKLIESSLLSNPALLQHIYHITFHYSLHSMCDRYSRLLFSNLIQCLLNILLVSTI